MWWTLGSHGQGPYPTFRVKGGWGEEQVGVGGGLQEGREREEGLTCEANLFLIWTNKKIKKEVSKNCQDNDSFKTNFDDDLNCCKALCFASLA